MSHVLEPIVRDRAYLIARWGPLLMVVWRERLVDAGIDVIERELGRLCGEHAAAGSLIVIEAGCALPTDAQRERLSAMVPRFGAVIADALVFEGTGLQRTIVRSIATMLSLVSSTKKRGMEVLSNVDAASAWLAKMLGKTPAAFEAAALAGAVREWRKAA